MASQHGFLARGGAEEAILTMATSTWPSTSYFPMPGRLSRLLVVDDDPAIPVLLGQVARQLSFEVIYKDNGGDALACLGEIRPDAALVDLRMPGLGGIDVLRAIRVAQPECQVILMTADATVDSAIEAVKAGAVDYLSKPFDFARLRGLLTSVREGQRRRARLLEADAEVARKFEFRGMIGRSPAMQELFDSIRRLAPHARTVLITGETGTGKELVAKALHEMGTRSRKRLVTLNCSAVVENLFESELFGHVRGAFTGATDNKVGLFEHADGGTIFLDEAGELPLQVQAKLLRAVELGDVQRVGSLQPRHVDVAVIAATNRDLRAEAAAGRFRSDLYFRLAIIEIFLPPLRERREDIPLLTATFIRGCATRLKKPIAGITPAAERYLQQAPWLGNIRELRNVIERACIQCDGKLLGERDLQSAMPLPLAAGAAPPETAAMASAPGDAPGPIGQANLLSTAQREQIHRVLREAGGNKAAAARLLGVSRRSLYRWLARLDADN
jgi:DNA-binding NtrC family response regulator